MLIYYIQLFNTGRTVNTETFFGEIRKNAALCLNILFIISTTVAAFTSAEPPLREIAL
ncbi:MAG: hypothetical protein LBG27_09040 [Spirochaetaceae bacterium]|jgi:hypothetical protein|nr:hypothetical protein [Spirochaetaceae bacterium]